MMIEIFNGLHMNTDTIAYRLPLWMIMGLMSALTIDLLIASMSAFENQFAISAHHAERIMSVCLIGMTIGQLFCGFLSDQLGRKSTFYIAATIYQIACLLAIVSSTFMELLLCRGFQGLAASIITTNAYAMVRDVCDEKHMTRNVAYMGAALALSPGFAPYIGSQLIVKMGINGLFYGLITMMLLQMFLMLPMKETCPFKQKKQKFSTFLKPYLNLLCDPNCRYQGLMSAFSFAGFAAFMTVSSYIFLEQLKLSQTSFLVVFSSHAIAFFISGIVTATLTKHHWTSARINTLGISILAYCAGAMILAYYIWPNHRVAGLVIPNLGMAFALTMLLSSTMSGAVFPHPENAATVSAVIIFLRLLICALASSVISFLIPYGIAILPWMLACLTACAYICYLMIPKN